MSRARRGGYRLVVLDAMRREIHPLRDLRAYRELTALLRELKPHIMHSHSSKAGILARRAAAEAGGMKIVHTVHGLAFHPYQSRWMNLLYVILEKNASRRTDAIVSVADAMTRQALAAGVGRPEQYVTIYSGMETGLYANPAAEASPFRASLNLPPGALLVTQVSRLAELKGHEYLIEAAAGLDERIHFCFVGDGRLRSQIEERIARNGLSSRFHLTGLVGPERIPAVMQASDIVAHCSLREGLARTLPQAMLAGKPVVTFDVDGACEVVDHNTGVLLDPRNVPDLRAAIELLAASEELRQSLGQAGKERCLTMFDHRRMVEQIEALYAKL
jgi:glycosyltransferase involved in cell wall biosynthesis